MRHRALIIAALLVTAVPVWAGQPGARAEYIGGTRSEIPDRETGTLQAIDEEYLVFYAKKANIRIRYDRINLLEYGQKVDRRYAMALLVSPMLLLSKKRQHFLTVGFVDDDGREQALIFKVAKDHIRAMLVTLEVRTGRKVEFQDQEARKAGKG
jgi:hypothetical protein